MNTKPLHPDDFVKRTGPVLYARFDENNAYFLTILNHGEWSNDALIEIIHANWPASIERFKLPVLGLVRKLTPKERATLRKGNIDSLIQLTDGTVYMPPGGGVSTDGTPTNVSLQMMGMKRSLRIQQERVRKIELVAAQPEAKQWDKILRALPAAAKQYRDQITKGFGGNVVEAGRARVAVRTLLGGEIVLKPAKDRTHLVAHLHFQKVALLGVGAVQQRFVGSGGRI